MIKMKTSIYYKALALCLLLLFAQGAAAVVFEVTTAEELQAALATAASNGGDDTIYLSGSTLVGNFRFKNEEPYRLSITGVSAQQSVLNGNNEAFVFDILMGGHPGSSVSLSQVTITGGSSEVGSGVNFEGEMSGANVAEASAPALVIDNVNFSEIRVAKGLLSELLKVG